MGEKYVGDNNWDQTYHLGGIPEYDIVDGYAHEASHMQIASDSHGVWANLLAECANCTKNAELLCQPKAS